MLPKGDSSALTQIFADDISVAAAHARRLRTVQFADGLSGPLIKEHVVLVLGVAAPKRCNSLIDGCRACVLDSVSCNSGNLRHGLKEQNRHRTGQCLDRIQSFWSGGEALQPPFQSVYSFELLCVVLDCD